MYRVGVKVKKFKLRRHSPIYYVILGLVACVLVYGYVTVTRFIEETRLKLPWDPAATLVDPFQGREELARFPTPDNVSDEAAYGALVRFMECWKIGSDAVDTSCRRSGYQCMLWCIRYSDVNVGYPHHTTRELKKRYGGIKGIKLLQYTIRDAKVINEKDPRKIEFTVDIRGRDPNPNLSLEKQGAMYPTVIYERHEGWGRAMWSVSLSSALPPSID